METLPRFTLNRAYQILKEAAMFSKSLPVENRINTFAVLYESKDLQKTNLGMKHTDYLSGRFWTNGSVSMNEISTPYPLFAVIEFPNKWIEMFKCNSYTIYDLWLLVADVIKEDEIGTTDGLAGRNLTEIFEDTEESLRFIKYYFSKVEPFHVVTTAGSSNGWYNKDHLAYLLSQGAILSYGGVSEYPEFTEYYEWWISSMEKFNASCSFDRYAFQSKDNIAATRLNIQFPMLDYKEYEPGFYIDTKVIKYD